jgi:hypothetical protein
MRRRRTFRLLTFPKPPAPVVVDARHNVAYALIKANVDDLRAISPESLEYLASLTTKLLARRTASAHCDR